MVGGFRAHFACPTLQRFSLECVLIRFVGAKLVFALLLAACVYGAILVIAPTDVPSEDACN